MTFDAQRARAIALHREGQLAEAERLYSDLLRRNPADFDVLYLQGVIAHQTGRHERAVELIGSAIALHRGSAALHAALGEALLALGRYREALAAYDAALALQPEEPNALCASASALRALGRPAEALARAAAAVALRPTMEAYCVQGAALRDLGHSAQAVASFDRAIALAPGCAEAYDGRGIALQQLQRTGEALASFEQALALRPGSAELHNNRGNVLRQLRRLPEALASYERAIALQPGLAAAYNNRGLVLQALERYREAAASYAHAIALADLPEAYNNLGTMQCELGEPAAAVASGRRALELRPGMSGVHGNLANALRDLERPDEALAESELGIREEPAKAANYCHRGNALLDLKRLTEAVASYDRAIELDPHDALAHFNKGLALLLTGGFAEGLPLYEWRKHLRGYSVPTYRTPAWTGEQDISGKTLLVHADQALGDTIHCCRYALLAAGRGAQVVLAVQPQLRELMMGLGPTLRIVPLGEQPVDCDYHIALMSLPLAFGTTVASIPATVPYLSAQPQRAALWGRRLREEGGLKVGIAWQGSRNRIDIGRSVPLAMYARLAAINGVRLISLQKGTALEELRAAGGDFPIEIPDGPFDAGPQAFLDSAALMTQLDLIITSDTALAHLAGALGRPTWIALKHVPDWRWLLDRADSPWYPSVRLFRQPRRGDWGGAFADIHQELTRLALAPARPVEARP